MSDVMTTHSPQRRPRPYPCPCGKRFRSHAELVRHQRECRAAGGGTVVRRTA